MPTADDNRRIFGTVPILLGRGGNPRYLVRVDGRWTCFGPKKTEVVVLDVETHVAKIEAREVFHDAAVLDLAEGLVRAHLLSDTNMTRGLVLSGDLPTMNSENTTKLAEFSSWPQLS